MKLKVFIIAAFATVSIMAIGYVISFFYALSHPPEDFQYHDNYFVVTHINWPLTVVVMIIICFIIYKYLNRKSGRK